MNKRVILNSENSKFKCLLQEQQRRVQNAKLEHQKQRKEEEKALSTYQKFKEKPENQSNIAETDKLRVLSLDKEIVKI